MIGPEGCAGGTSPPSFPAMTRRTAILIALLGIAAAAIILLAMGRPPICTCGVVALWEPSTHGPRTSQMLSDWYTPSHIIHGMAFYGLLWLFFRRWPVERRFLAAVGLEVGWELIENTPIVIRAYREATIAVGYNGDSVLNSLSDIAMMTLGFLLARRLPVWASVALAVIMELVALAVIRDNLALNILMLLAPNDAIRAWQGG
jgi:hypothetical protein